MALYCSLLRDPSGESVTFTLEEVSEAVKSLKYNKASGPDELDPQHLIYGVELLLEHVANFIVQYNHGSHLHPLILPSWPSSSNPKGTH